LLPKPNNEMEYFDQFCTDIKVISYNPLLTLRTLEYELKDPTVKAVVVESYSSANLPMKEDVLELFKKASDQSGLIIVNISQCTY
jgi:L-asparaginase/Glu-tRNA(Gln) amidotransferase subunit D